MIVYATIASAIIAHIAVSTVLRPPLPHPPVPVLFTVFHPSSQRVVFKTVQNQSNDRNCAPPSPSSYYHVAQCAIGIGLL